jgi:hypothetical protein
MHATITELVFKSPDARQQATEALAALFAEARELDGVEHACLVQTGELTATLLTFYASKSAAETASARLRPQLTEAIGARVAGPPRRVAGEVVARM